MLVVAYESSRKADWDRLVVAARNATFLHQRDFMDYHADRFEDASLLVCDDDGKPAAVFPASRHADHIVSHGGLTYGGLLMPPAMGQIECLAAFAAIAAHYREHAVRTVHYKVVPHVFHKSPAEEDLYALFRVGATLVRRDASSVIDLTERLSYSKGRKWSVKKARGGEQIIAESNDFSAFHALLTKVLIRHGATPVHTVAELDLLKSRFPGGVRLFLAQLHGEVAAGALLFDFGHVVHAQYLAVSEAGRDAFALDLLLDRLISEVFADRRHFSFGISTEQAGMVLNEGLLRQKEGFGARTVVHDFYDWHL